MRFYGQRWLRWLPGDVEALATWPFIWYRDKTVSASLVRHEETHLRQQTERLLVGFYVLYGFYYLVNRLHGMDHREAVHNIRYETEARRGQQNVR